MSRGAELDYSFTEKYQWRKSAWNAVARRVKTGRGWRPGVPLHKAQVLYLAGEQDLDREVAIRLGFKPNNLIAIERNKPALRALREKGTLTIEGDLSEIINAWNPKNPIHVVWADLCGGVSRRTIELAYELLEHPAFEGGVFMFNLLRGRDPYWTSTRAAIEKELTNFPDKDTKHRGRILFRQLILSRSYNAAREMNMLDNYLSLYPSQYCLHQPLFYSYQSITGQYMDSVVFSGYMPYNWNNDDDLNKGDPIRRKIAAVLAHQSRRL